MSFRTNSRICSSCSGVGGLSSNPITYSRTVVAPRDEATLHEIPRFSRYCKYSASVFHLISYLMSACCFSAYSRTRSLTGPIDSPSPIISVLRFAAAAVVKEEKKSERHHAIEQSTRPNVDLKL